jgi:hypothetical protein
MDLYQGIYWEDEGGNKLRIADMSPRYAYNCTRWLEALAGDIAFVDSGKWIGSFNWVSGEQASYDLDREMDRDFAEKEDPVAWIKSTELWQALDREPTIYELFDREES